MTDLVSQLVGALEHCEGVFMAHEINRVNGDQIADDALDIIRAALTAAKAGGWVAVQSEPVAYGIATERGALHSVKTSLVAANKCAEKWRQKQAENGFANWRCHVVPLAPLPNPPKEQSAGGPGSVDAVANPLSPT